MKTILLFSLFSLSAAASPDGVSLSVVRSVVVAMSETAFDIEATATASVPFTDILAGLRSAGVSAANLTGASQTFSGIDSQTGQIIYANRWSFRITVPSVELSASITRLTAVLSAAQQASGGRITMTLSSAGQQPSPADIAAARRAALPEMWNELRSRAELLAGTVGRSLPSLGSLAFSEASEGYAFDPGYTAALIDFATTGTARSRILATFTLSADFADTNSVIPSITVTSARPDTSPAHLLVLVTLTGPLAMTTAQAVERLQPLGITLNDISAAGLGTPLRTTSTGATQTGPPSESRFAFRMIVPENELAATLSRIDQVARTISSTSSRLTYSVSGIASHPEDRRGATPQAWAAIVSECRSLSEEVARAAGREAGGFLGVAESPSGVLSRAPFHLSLRYELR